MKRYLYLWHRWLGIALCLFMALWFGSGVVMLYVGYPKLTPAESLARLLPLPAQNCCVTLGTALAASGESGVPQSVKLTSVANEPTYLLGFPNKAQVAVDARSGQRIAPLDEAAALAAGLAFAGGTPVQYLGLVHEDMWSHARALSAERPFHVVQVDDPQQRWLYISQHNGRILLDITAQERVWNWLGAWLHWLYPLRGGVLDRWAADFVIYLSLAGTLAAVLGQVVGIMRWRFAKPYRSGSRSPYPGSFARWHHIGGIQCAADEETSILSNDVRAFDFTGIRQLTRDGFEDVGHGEKTNEVTEFVHHESDVSRLFTHLLQGVENRETVQQVDGVAGHGFQIGLVSRQQLLEQLLLVDKPQRLINTPLPNQRQPGVRRVHQPCADFFWSVGQVNVVDFCTRGHDIAYRAFRQLKYATDHDAFPSMENLFGFIA